MARLGRSAKWVPWMIGAVVAIATIVVVGPPLVRLLLNAVFYGL